MSVLELILPIFALIVTGYLARHSGHLSEEAAHALILFAYKFAMPALLYITVARQPVETLLDLPFWICFGGGSLLAFALVLLVARRTMAGDLRRHTMVGLSASMTNSGFVALPILHAFFGDAALPPAAIASFFIAAVMFPLALALFAFSGKSEERPSAGAMLVDVLINPMVWPTLLGIAVAGSGIAIPRPVDEYVNILAAALTPVALVAIGATLEVRRLRDNALLLLALSLIKLVLLPIVVLALAIWLDPDPLSAVAAVICAAVPTAKTAYILAGQHHVEEGMVAAAISVTNLLSAVTLVLWLYLLAKVFPAAFVGL